MLPEVFLLSNQFTDTQNFFRICNDLLGYSVTLPLDEAKMDGSREPSFIVALGEAIKPNQRAKDILINPGTLIKHTSLTFITIYNRTLCNEFNNYTNLDTTELKTKDNTYITIASGSLYTWKLAIIDSLASIVVDDFCLLMNMCMLLIKQTGFRDLWVDRNTKTDVKGFLRFTK